MAFAHETTRIAGGMGETMSVAIYALTQRISNYVAYRRTIAALSKLSAQELHDLGLHRGGITRAARESVYGL